MSIDMIPHKIHYCWFGKNEKNKNVLNCIDSWRKNFPDYEIIEWNEDNFDIFCCPYVQEAYQQQKWAFVSDYVRFWCLFYVGGIYFDTDVEVLRDMSDILVRGPYMGLQKDLSKSDDVLNINPGLGMAAYKGMPILKDILNLYERQSFCRKGGKENLKTVVQYTTELFQAKGYNGDTKNINFFEGIYIYPTDYFCPMDTWSGKIDITSNTYTIHHFDASWYNGIDRLIMLIFRSFSRYGKVGYILSQIVVLPFRILNKFYKSL